MKSYLQLIKKELRALRWYLGVLMFLTLGWHLFLATRVQRWPAELVFGLGWIPISFIPIWLLWISVQMYRSEWNQDTAYLLLSLPIPGWQITTSKFLVVMIAYVFSVVLFAASFFLALGGSIMQIVGDCLTLFPTIWYLRTGLNAFVLSVLLVSSATMLTHFSYISARMVKRFQGLVMVWILVLSVWLMERLGYVIEPLLRWVPWMTFEIGNYSQGMVHMGEFQMSLAPILAPWLIVVALFALGTWLWETQIEIV